MTAPKKKRARKKVRNSDPYNCPGFLILMDFLIMAGVDERTIETYMREAHHMLSETRIRFAGFVMANRDTSKTHKQVMSDFAAVALFGLECHDLAIRTARVFSTLMFDDPNPVIKHLNDFMTRMNAGLLNEGEQDLMARIKEAETLFRLGERP